MTICLSHNSALAYWRIQASGPSDELRVCAKASPPKDVSLSSEALSPMHLDRSRLIGPYTPKLHVLVSPESSVFQHPRCQMHRSRHLPNGRHIIQVSNYLQVCSPEFCFLQMARSLSLIQLIQLGFELCGSYVLTPPDSKDEARLERWGHADLPDFQGTCQPITTPKQLQDFLAAQSGFDCLGKARRAAKYVLAGSESPRETSMDMLLSLPYMMGGCCLRNLELNHEFELSKEAQIIAGKRSARPDAWVRGTKITVEYDSDMYHSGEEKRLTDSRRRNGLRVDGFTVYEVTTAQFDSYQVLSRILASVAKRAGKGVYPRVSDFENRQRSLYAELADISNELHLF